MKECRICSSFDIKTVCKLLPYKEYSFDIYDCQQCGCRFVYRDGKIHEDLHSAAGSPYAFQSAMASEAVKYYKICDELRLRKYLSKTPKFKFIIDSLANYTKNMSILEIGCSQGYLTSYFKLRGHSIIGADISPTAIKKATSNFGNYFKLIKGDDFSFLGSFDIIYHLGTIGCVDDPIKFTNELLNMLKPKGILLFNAPNLDAILKMNSIWVSTPPPDLITIFPNSFWHKFFGDKVEVKVTYEPYDHVSNLNKNLGMILNRNPNNSRINSIFNNDMQSKRHYLESAGEAVKGNLCKCISCVSGYFLPRYPLDYGMFITMKK